MGEKRKEEDRKECPKNANSQSGTTGKRIVDLQTSQALLSAPQVEKWPLDAKGRPLPDKYGRRPFLHSALNGLPALSEEAKSRVLDKTRLANLAERYGLDKVARWKPKRVRFASKTNSNFWPQNTRDDGNYNV